MKIRISQQVYGQLGDRDKDQLKPVACGCANSPTCEACEGTGTVYEWALSPEDSAAIQDNLRKQGVPLGKIGTH